jgi:endonuclease IV
MTEEINKHKFGTGLGAHIHKVENYGNHAEVLMKYYLPKMPQIGCWQIFSHGPHGAKLVIQDNPKEVLALAKKIPLFIHTTYMTSPTDKGMWHIVEQFIIANDYGAKGVIIHIPKTSVPNIVKITQTIITSYANTKGNAFAAMPKIIWEAKALKQSKESFETPQKWNVLAKALQDINIGPNTVGFNIDTAHIYASGALINTSKQVTEWLDGLSPLCMTYMKSGVFHLNGNHYDQKLRAGDKHMVPGFTDADTDDKIWKNIKDITDIKESGCAVFIKWCKQNKIPIILELKPYLHGIDNIANFANKFN